MSYELNTVVRHLVALAGADPCKVRLPEGEYKLRVHGQRIGDVRLITVAPLQGALPEVDTRDVAHLCTENDVRCLQRPVVAWHRQRAAPRGDIVAGPGRRGCCAAHPGLVPGRESVARPGGTPGHRPGEMRDARHCG